MSLRNLLWFYRVRLRARAGAGAAGRRRDRGRRRAAVRRPVANTSLSGSVAQLTHGLVGDAQLQLAARGPQGFDERLLREVQDTPGVRAAAPDAASAQVNVVGPGGAHASVLCSAADPRFARLGGPLLRGFTASELARQQARRACQRRSRARSACASASSVTRAGRAGGRVSVPVGAQSRPDDVGALVDSPVVVAPLAYAQELDRACRGASRASSCVPRPGRRGARSRRRCDASPAGRVDVRPADFDARLFKQAATPNDQSTALFSAFSALVGFLFAFSAMLLTVPQRRRLIADLRIAGTAPGWSIQVLLFDALVLGVVASAVGLAIGDQLSRHLFHPSPGYLAFAFPVGSQRASSTGRASRSRSAAALLAAVLAALAPLVAAFRAPAMDARRRGHARPTRGGPTARGWLVAGGVGCLAVTTSILRRRAERRARRHGCPRRSRCCCCCRSLLAAMLRAARPRYGGGSRACVPVPRDRRAAVARGSALARRRGDAAVAVFGSVAIQGAHGDLQRGLDPHAHDLNAVDRRVGVAGRHRRTCSRRRRSRRERRRRDRDAPAGRGGHVYRGELPRHRRPARLGARRRRAGARDPIPPTQILDGDLATATRADARAAAGRSSRRPREGARTCDVGERVHARLAGPDALPRRGDQHEHRMAARARSSSTPTTTRAPGAATTPARCRSTLAPATSPRGGRSVVRSGARSGLRPRRRDRRRSASSAHAGDDRAGLSRLTQIAALVLVAAVLAMAAAMGGMIWQRRARLADSRSTGSRQRRAVARAAAGERVLLGAGCTIGAVFGLSARAAQPRADAVTGFPVDYSSASRSRCEPR